MSFRVLPVICLLVVVFPSCITRTIAEKDIFHPVKFTGPSGEFLREEVTLLTEDSLRIDAWFVKHENARGTVLYSGGNGFGIRTRSTGELVTLFKGLGMSLLVYDYRGYGRSEGSPTLAGILKDGRAALRYLRTQRDVNTDRIIVYGHSLGTVVALDLATTERLAGVVLQNPLTNAAEMRDVLVSLNVPWFARWLVDVELDSSLYAIDNLGYVRRLSAPLLVLTGEHDELTPPDMGTRLAGASGSGRTSLVMIPGADHNDMFFTRDERRVRYLDAVGDYFDAILPSDSARPVKPAGEQFDRSGKRKPGRE